MYYSEYPIISVTADMLLCLWSADSEPSILLVQRKNEPFKDFWALPGGFVNPGESTARAARRELQEETGYVLPSDETYFRCLIDAPERDPRGRVISLVYGADLFESDFNYSILKAGDDAACVDVFPNKVIQNKKIPLAFDHYDVIYNEDYGVST